jgi:hypothetical protein
LPPRCLWRRLGRRLVDGWWLVVERDHDGRVDRGDRPRQHDDGVDDRERTGR